MKYQIPQLKMSKEFLENFLADSWTRVHHSNCFEHKNEMIRIFLNEYDISVSTKNFMGDYTHLCVFPYDIIFIRNGQVVIEMELS